MPEEGAKKEKAPAGQIPPEYGGQIKDPNVNDVLSGRGGRINSHPGNIQYRQLVNHHKHAYLSKQTKKLDKVKIADKLVQTIRNMNPPGRFLKEDPKTHLWLEIGDEKARKKAGQAMREKADETRKELEHQETAFVGNTTPSPNSSFGAGQNLGQPDVHPSLQQQYYNMARQQQQMQSPNSFGMGFTQQNQQQQPGGFMGSNNMHGGMPNNSFLAAAQMQQQQMYQQNQQGQFGTQQFPNQISNEEQRRKHAEILNGNAVAFDREFNRMRGSDSSGSRVHSLATSGVSSMPNDSSSSSIMSMLSQGKLSQNELMQLALQQQQQQQQMGQQMGQMGQQIAMLDSLNEYQLNQMRQGLGGHMSPGQMQAMGGQRGLASGSLQSGQSGMSDVDKRRLFQQNREQSYSSADLKAAENGAHPKIQPNQLMQASLGTLGSMNLDSVPQMSSMGFGSTNNMTSMNMASMMESRNENAQRKRSNANMNMGISSNISDNTLMNILADAAEGLSYSQMSFNMRSPIPSTGSVPSDSRSTKSGNPSLFSGATPGNLSALVGSTQPNSNTVTSAGMSNMQRPSGNGGDQNNSNAATPNANNGMSTSNSHPYETHSMSISTSAENAPQQQQSQEKRKVPERRLSRNLSTKSDVSMGSNGSWYNEVRNLASLRNMGHDDSRLRLFTESSARSLMSDLSENMSALDLASFEQNGSRRDLFGEMGSGMRSSRRDIYDDTSSRRDSTNV